MGLTAIEGALGVMVRVQGGQLRRGQEKGDKVERKSVHVWSLMEALKVLTCAKWCRCSLQIRIVIEKSVP